MRKEERTRSPSPNNFRDDNHLFISAVNDYPVGGTKSPSCLDPEFCSARGLTCVQVEMKTPQTTRGSPVLLLLLTGVCIDAYKPVIIVHGILDGPREFKTMSLFISKVGRVFKK